MIRKLLFREKVVLSVLTERRSTQPYGLNGSHPGDSLPVLFAIRHLILIFISLKPHSLPFIRVSLFICLFLVLFQEGRAEQQV